MSSIIEELKSYLQTPEGMLWFHDMQVKSAAYEERHHQEERNKKASSLGFPTPAEERARIDRQIREAEEKRNIPLPATAGRKSFEDALAWPGSKAGRKASLYLAGNQDSNIVKVALLEEHERMGAGTIFLSGDIPGILSGENMIVVATNGGKRYLITLTD